MMRIGANEDLNEEELQKVFIDRMSEFYKCD